MRVSLKWLEDFVAIDVPVERLVEMLDLSGTKVEAVHRPAEGIEGVVVAEVTEINEHPNADALTLVDVRRDGGASERVVCGARNFSVGDRVPLATVGARLPGMEIGERKIRGEVSRGMLCSAAELGVSKDHSGILVLPSDAALGDDVVAVLGLDDTILELELTPNRPDCMSIIGVAREISALLGNELKLPSQELVAAHDVASPVDVEIAAPEGCPRYLARYIEGVSIGPSPAWVANRLLACGIRPIANVVDATNYALLEMGHPLHAFDAAQVAEHKIVVRRAHRGERFVTLDGVERAMSGDDLMIADAERSIGIAGVMGGQTSEVSDETTAVILESAYFDRVSIALTARRHLLRTEASARFERGADPEIVAPAAARAAQLMVELAGGRVAPKEVDLYPRPIARAVIELRPARTDRLLGVEIGAHEQAGHLGSIGLSVTERGEALEVEVPGFRPDLTREVDLIEEVARLAGFDRLPSTIPPGHTGRLERVQEAERRVRNVLTSLGVSEAWTSSFLSEPVFDALGIAPDSPARNVLPLVNPTSEDERALRTTLLVGLLGAAARNLAQRAPGVALFELGRVYEPEGGQLPHEATVIGGVFSGERRRQSWRADEAPWDFFAVKTILEALVAALGVGPVRFSPVSGLPFHPTRAASVALRDTALGVLGELHPEVCDRFDVSEGTVAFELALEPVWAALPGRQKATELARFPAVYIDLAVVVDEGVAAGHVTALTEKAGGDELTSVRLFDVYRGEQVPEGQKSLAYALELRDPQRTLTDDDAVRVRERIVATLQEEVGAQLRQ